MALVYKELSNRKSTHLPNWNYGAAATYFITICTRKRIQFLGEIVSNENYKLLMPSPLGEEVSRQWYNIPFVRPDMNIQLDAFQIMPDHLHGIIKIGINKFNEHLYQTKELPENPFLISTNYIDVNKPNLPNAHNLHSIIRGFKSAVTKYSINNNLDFKWQRGYFDHIIRSNIELEVTRDYIVTNPDRWIL